ncbi:MAG: histone-lysine N-methyltransferase [Candidatus Aureabacteria bacterium]|nr:histone-lysine N-methyltransferase [Candidatus Auribacterota bacterium]
MTKEKHKKKQYLHGNFAVQDVKEANLFREFFPYKHVPRIFFDNMFEIPSLPQEIWITDTTFRDGQQSRPPYTVEQIEKLFDFLHRLSGEKGLIRQTEFFLYSNKDREAVEKCLSKDYKYPEITGWIRAVKQDFDIVKKMGLKETGILTSCSDYHIFLKLKKTRSQALDDYLGIVKHALSEGIVPRCHFEDITRADYFGFVIPFAQELMNLAEEAKMPIKIRSCDTLGFGVTYPGSSLPRSVPKIISGLKRYAHYPSEWLEWHGHNDFHKVLVSATTAWYYGSSAANGTLLGFGERTGNPPIEGLLVELCGIKQIDEPIDMKAITEAAEYVSKNMGFHVPANYPFVGKDFNVTRAGIHADGILKNEEIYNIFDTEKLLGRPLRVAITDKSGTAGIARWINDYLNLKGEKAVKKTNPEILHIKKWIDEQYENNRVTSISEDEMLIQVKAHFPQFFESELEKIKQKARDASIEILSSLLGDDRIQSLNKSKMQKAMLETVEKFPFIQFVYVTDPAGKQLTDNITQPFRKSEYDKQFPAKQDFSDREWFKKPMQDGEIFTTKLFTSKIDSSLCLTVSGPIMKKSKDQILGILGMDIRFEDISKIEAYLFGHVQQ